MRRQAQIPALRPKPDTAAAHTPGTAVRRRLRQ